MSHFENGQNIITHPYKQASVSTVTLCSRAHILLRSDNSKRVSILFIINYAMTSCPFLKWDKVWITTFPGVGSFTKIRTSLRIIRIYVVGKAIKIPLK